MLLFYSVFISPYKRFKLAYSLANDFFIVLYGLGCLSGLKVL